MSEAQKLITKKYYINGLKCSSCAVKVKKELINLEGVHNAEVSISESCVELQVEHEDHIPSKAKLNEMFYSENYKFFETNQKENNLNKSDKLRAFFSFLLLVVFFYILEKNGIFSKFTLNSESTIFAYFLFGVAAGLSSCAALVGGLLLTMSKSWIELYSSGKKSIKPFVYFNLSRILTFGILGGFFGYFGTFFKISSTLTIWLSTFIAFVMLIIGFQMIGIKWFYKFNFSYLANRFFSKNTNFQGKYLPLMFGSLTFFIPCGFTLIAQTNALNSGSFENGFLFLTSFALGTLPILFLISFTSFKLSKFNNFYSKFSYFSGILIIFIALYTLKSQLNFVDINNFLNFKNKDNVTTLNTNKVQLIQIEAKGLEYFPKKFTLQSGVKTKMLIFDNGALGCAKALFAKGLYPNIISLQNGMNEVDFIAPAPGTYKITCSMGMVDPVVVEVL